MLACGPEQGAILCPGTITLGTVDARAVLQATAALSERSTSTIQQRERWVLLKIPRCDIDGVGKVK